MAGCACIAGRAVLVGLLAAMAAFPAPGQEGGAGAPPPPVAPVGSAAGEAPPAATGGAGDAGALPQGDGADAGDAGAPPEAEGGGGAILPEFPAEGAAPSTPGAAPSAPGAAVPATPEAAARAPALVTLDQDRFFRASAFGRAALARAEATASALAVENRRIEGELEAEEKSLTGRRANLPPGEFSSLAHAFDAKVERIRKEQDEKSRAIGQGLDGDRARFFDAAGPVLAEMLSQTGALAILSDSAVILSLGAIDVTDEAIARMDARIGAGDGLAEPGAPEAP